MSDIPRPTMRRKSSAQNLLSSFKPPASVPTPGGSISSATGAAYAAAAQTPTAAVTPGREWDGQSVHSDTLSSTTTLVANGTPTIAQGTSVEYLRDLVQKRIITLTYMRNVHEGCAGLFPSGELDRVFNNVAMKKRTNRFAVLAMSLSNLLDIPQAHDYLRGLLNTMNEYDQAKEEPDKPKYRLFRSKVAKRQAAGGFAEYTTPYSDGSDASYLVSPHIPFPLDYHQTLLSLLDVLSEVYNKISRILGPSAFSNSGQHMMGPLGLLAPHPGVSYLFSSQDVTPKPLEESDGSLWGIANAQVPGQNYGAGLGSPPPSWTAGLGDTLLKVDTKFKKITTILLKELDAVARNGIKDELASLDPLLRGAAATEDMREQYDFEGNLHFFGMPTNNVQVLLAQDIADPTDFAENHLRQLDASFRCTICGEFFDAPISLACGHCFCSLCIREHIVREPECPSCRKSATEAHFRVNPALEEVVSAWKAARSNVLHLSREERPKVNSGQNIKTPRRFRTPVQNGRKRRHTEVSQSSDSDVVCVAGPSKPDESSEIADSSPLQAKSARKASRRPTHVEPSSDPREEEILSVQPDSLVECPVCGDSVEFQVINTHMDGPDCGQKLLSKDNNPSNPNAKTQWSKLLGSKSKKGKNKDNSDLDDTMERLPKVSYDVLKDKALRELLSSQHLPVNGDRNTRIARHRRWVMMYNANLDKTTCHKTLRELRLELRTWEEGQKGPKFVVEDTSAHEASHREEFSRLIEEARQRRSNRSISGDALREGVAEDGHEEYL
ncbi:hypothetical protein J3R83DRAFT_1682 [Lanmaoa asiatica]|nr:hypothetical protein J3R83DRAFT_1682 [Lanmaoa asiatica]